jgi:predicted transposase/invertase (TIGR01784 family)
MRIVYLELPKFLRQLGQEFPANGLERWLLYFCNEGGTRMSKVMEEDKILTLAKELETSFWANEEEKEMYFRRQRALMDAYSAEHTYEYLLAEKEAQAEARGELRGKIEGEIKGKIEGRIEGIEEGVTRVARNFLRLGADIDQIAQASGLSAEEIEKLR